MISAESPSPGQSLGDIDDHDRTISRTGDVTLQEIRNANGSVPLRRSFTPYTITARQPPLFQAYLSQGLEVREPKAGRTVASCGKGVVLFRFWQSILSYFSGF